MHSDVHRQRRFLIDVCPTLLGDVVESSRRRELNGHRWRIILPSAAPPSSSFS